MAVKLHNGMAGGKKIKILKYSSDATPDKAVAATRKAVEQDHVDIMIGPLSGDEGIAVKNYSKTHPEMVFVNGSSGAQATTLQDPSPNFYRFNTEGAQWMVGLGDVALAKGYKKMWLVAEDYGFPYSQVQGFMASYCAKGGHMVKKAWVPLGTKDYSSIISGIPGDVEGVVVTNALPKPLDNSSERARIADELIDALVELHAVDWRAVGLEGFGKPTGYLERQLRRFTGLWEHNKTREVPAVETVGAWLEANLPESPPATIVHGDYRLGNTMLAVEAPARLIGIFDWEMATIGDPLADLGYMMIHWIQAGDEIGKFNLHSVTSLPGFPTRQELIARYEQRSGRSMQALNWYVTLALWKAIVFMEGNYKRALAGSTDDPFLKSFGDGVLELAARAVQVSEHGF